MVFNTSHKTYLSILVIGAILFLPFLGGIHLFDWDEINFAECTREMIVTQDYLSVKINFKPFWEKPPIFIWMQAACMNLFGINEFSARLPNAICGICTLLFIYFIGRKHFSHSLGFFWALCYTGSFLPHFYFRSGIIDPWFNLFIFSSIYFLFLFFQYSDKKIVSIMVAAFFAGIAILTKGPVALILIGITTLIFILLNKKLISYISIKHVFIFSITLLLVGGSWFIIEIANGKWSIILEFIEYQKRLLTTEDSGHGGPIYYHVIVLLLGCFPSSILLFSSIRKNDFDTLDQKKFKQWMILLLLVVLIIFSIVKTKIVHYSSLCYFPITFLAAYSIEKIIHNQLALNKWIKQALTILGITIAVILSSPYFIQLFKNDIANSGIVKDKFAAEILETSIVHWSGFETVVGIVMIIGLYGAYSYFKKNALTKGFISLLSSTTLVIMLSIYLIVPKIEAYSQKAAIDFYESKKEENCYIQTIGFKSYAQYFYKQTNEEQILDSLLIGKIEKPAYFVVKITHAEECISSYPALKKVGQKNGFVFLKRESN